MKNAAKACFLLFAFTIALITTVQCKAQDKIILGMSAAFTGSSRGLGIELYRGSKAYFDKVNAAGGIKGKMVEIKYYDDGYNPDPAIRNTIQLIQKDHATCLFNYVGTPTVTRVLPILKHFNESESIYMFFPFSGADPQRKYPYNHFVFNLRPSYTQETQGLISNLYNTGRKRIAVLYQADAYGRSGWAGVRSALEEKGLKIVSEATYARGTSFNESMKEQVKILKQKNPDAIICVGTYAACAAFIRDARDMGVAVPICNLSFVGSENLLALLTSLNKTSNTDYTKNLINTQVVPSYEDLSLPAVREYRELMDNNTKLTPEKYKTNYTPLKYSFVSFEGFLNAKVMHIILKKMFESNYFDDIYEATLSLRSFDIGIDTPVIFDHGRHQGLNKIYFMTVSDGKFISITDWKRWNK